MTEELKKKYALKEAFIKGALWTAFHRNDTKRTLVKEAEAYANDVIALELKKANADSEVHQAIKTEDSSPVNETEIQLLRVVYEAARRVLRYNGVDKEKVNQAVDELDDAIEQVKLFDGGLLDDHFVDTNKMVNDDPTARNHG